jgi:response regulator RpfG family c-di-GMP phosphodiesterase
MTSPIRVLHVDDYPLDRQLVRDALERDASGFSVTEAASRAEFDAAMTRCDFDLVLSDFNILGFDGLQVLDAVHARDPRLPVVIVTGTGSEEVAVEAMKRGAADYVIKTPQHIRRLPLTIRAALRELHLEAEHARAREQIERQLQRLSALRAIDTAITASSDLRVSLGALISHVIAQLRVDAAAILRLRPGSQTMEFASGDGFRSPAIERAGVPLETSHAGRAASRRELVAIPDLRRQPDDAALAPALQSEEFVSYYAVPLIAKGTVLGVLELFHRSPLSPDSDWVEFLEMLAGQSAIAIDNAELFQNLQQSNADLVVAYNATIAGWSRALDLRDKETEGHTRRVTEMTLKLAEAMGLPESELVHIRRGALLHDMGKLGVPDHILLKPEPLDEDEWAVMRKHPQYAYDLLQHIDFLRPALDIPLSHHEKWDGTGYPRGLRGEQIPLAARIFAVVDVWDALCSDRPYRPAWPQEKVREHLQSIAGSHLDARVVERFLVLLSRS